MPLSSNARELLWIVCCAVIVIVLYVGSLVGAYYALDWVSDGKVSASLEKLGASWNEWLAEDDR